MDFGFFEEEVNKDSSSLGNNKKGFFFEDEYIGVEEQERVWKKEVGYLKIDYYQFSDSKIKRLSQKGFPQELLRSNKFVELHIEPSRIKFKNIIDSFDSLREELQTGAYDEDSFIVSISHLSKYLTRWGFSTNDISVDLIKEFPIYLGGTQGFEELADYVGRYKDDEDIIKTEEFLIKKSQYDAYQKMVDKFSWDDIKLAYCSVGNFLDR